VASKPRAKKVQQEKLKDISTITVTIQASEYNMQRLAALLLFCEHLEPTYKVAEAARPLPWEAPTPPGEERGLEIDTELVRREIAGMLVKHAEQDGVERTKELLKQFGGEGLSKIPPDQLLGLHQALEALLP